MPPPPPPSTASRTATGGGGAETGRGETSRRAAGGRGKDMSVVGGGALFGTPTPNQARENGFVESGSVGVFGCGLACC